MCTRPFRGKGWEGAGFEANSLVQYKEIVRGATDKEIEMDRMQNYHILITAYGAWGLNFSSKKCSLENVMSTVASQ